MNKMEVKRIDTATTYYDIYYNDDLVARAWNKNIADRIVRHHKLTEQHGGLDGSERKLEVLEKINQASMRCQVVHSHKLIDEIESLLALLSTTVGDLKPGDNFKIIDGGAMCNHPWHEYVCKIPDERARAAAKHDDHCVIIVEHADEPNWFVINIAKDTPCEIVKE